MSNITKVADLISAINDIRAEIKKLEAAADHEWAAARTAGDEATKYGKELFEAHAEAKKYGNEVSYFPKVMSKLAIAYINHRHFKDAYETADRRWHDLHKVKAKLHRSIDVKKRALAKLGAAIA